MRKYSDLKLKGKVVFKRIDINSPIEGGKVQPNPRILAHARSIAELRDAGAKVVLLAHQGRAGEEDFTSLEQHAKLLEKELGTPVYYVEDVAGEKAQKAITLLKNGEVLLLNNVRILPDETKSGAESPEVVRALAPLGHYFILDSLSVAHRSHASVVGFTNHMPSAAGKVLSDELEALKKMDGAKNITFFFGGSKVADSFRVMERWLASGRVKKILLGGALSVLFIYAKGCKIGESLDYLVKTDLVKHAGGAKRMLEKYPGKIEIPVDVGLNIMGKRVDANVNEIDRGMIFDIGEKTLLKYKEIIFDSDFIFVNGPAGVYEQKEFEFGTRHVLEAISRAPGFSLVGGGHTITAIEKFKIPKEKFGYISLSGKALVEYLSGNELPGLKGLKDNVGKFPL
ncbi:MAG: phosphoglycerate kinase [Candidatus ainarchaeum sp.]|nr:phosphoglycerate kinase [Candidatus ainarchaeum sp.]